MKRDHQVWSSGDEDEEAHNKMKGKICMVATTDEDGSTKMKRKYCYMAKGGTLGIIE